MNVTVGLDLYDGGACKSLTGPHPVDYLDIDIHNWYEYASLTMRIEFVQRSFKRRADMIQVTTPLQKTVGQLVTERPARARIFEAFGIDYCCGGKKSLALAIAEKARHDYPGVWEVIRFEADVLRQTKGPDSAIPLVEAYARDNWWHYGAAIALGRLYAEKGDVPRAEIALRHASWLDVHDAEALSLIASINLRQKRFEDAYKAQRRAVARQPDQPRQYVLLSDILEKMGRTAEARDALAQVARLKALGRDASALAN